MAKLEIVNGVPRMRPEASAPTIYDETLSITSTITAGTAVTLPAGRTYTSNELEIYLNGLRLTNVFDYLHTSSTQVTFTFDLLNGDIVRFRIDRAP